MDWVVDTCLLIDVAANGFLAGAGLVDALLGVMLKRDLPGLLPAPDGGLDQQAGPDRNRSGSAGLAAVWFLPTIFQETSPGRVVVDGWRKTAARR
jgi:hypothetical protein